MGVVICSTVPSLPFARRFAQRLGLPLSDVERRDFPDGERYLRFGMQDRFQLLEQHVVLVGATDTAESLEEMYRLACAAGKLGARSIVLVIPYLGYSTMERATRYGEVVTVKTIARQLSSIPRAPLGNWVLLMDLHSPGIVHYFEGEIVALELSSEPVLLPAIEGLGLRHLCLASTDMGRAKWVEAFANKLQAPLALIHKKRLSGSETKISAVVGEVAGQDVVIFDDMIRTGGSLVQAAEAYVRAGAASVRAVVPHLLLPRGTLERLEASPLSIIVATDTHPSHSQVEAHPRFQIVSVADRFAEMVARLVF